MTTSAVMTEAAGATMLVPNAVTRAEPTTPLASPLVSWLLSPMMRPPMHDARLTLPGARWPTLSRRVPPWPGLLPLDLLRGLVSAWRSTPSERHRWGMGEIDGRQHAGRAYDGGGPAFDLVLSK